MTKELQRSLAVAVLLPLLVMFASVSLLLWRLQELSVLTSWVNHSGAVLSAATHAQKNLADMEAGARGFWLSNDESFLASYVRSDQQFVPYLDGLVSLVQDNAEQLAAARELHARGSELSQQLARTVTDLRHPDGSAPARIVETLLARRDQVDRTNELLEQFIDRERVLRVARTDAATRATRITFWLTAVLLSAVGVSLAWFSRRQTQAVAGRFSEALERALTSQTIEREARETAQQAVRARDNFVSLASHELKTPLTSLRLQLQSLVRQATIEDVVPSERVLAKANAGLRQVDRLVQLVSDLMDVSRLASGQLPVRLQPVDVAALVRRLVHQCEEDSREAGCPLNLRAPSELVVEADAGRLEQVVLNLLTNALKYGRGEPVDVEVQAHASCAVISVGDRGIGIAKEDQLRIFKRFERADGAEHFQGVGLGLYIVRNLLELMGGEIEVESELGSGAKFSVTLPITNGANGPNGAKRAQSA